MASVCPPPRRPASWRLLPCVGKTIRRHDVHAHRDCLVTAYELWYRDDTIPSDACRGTICSGAPWRCVAWLRFVTLSLAWLIWPWHFLRGATRRQVALRGLATFGPLSSVFACFAPAWLELPCRISAFRNSRRELSLWFGRLIPRGSSLLYLNFVSASGRNASRVSPLGAFRSHYFASRPSISQATWR